MVKTRHRAAARNNTVIASVAVGVIAGMLTVILLSLLLTSLVVNGSIGEDKTGAYISVIRSFGCFTGCMLSTAFAKKQYLLVTGLTAAAYLVVLLAVGIVFYDGSFVHFGNGLLMTVIGCAAACMIRLKPPSKRKHRRRNSR